MESTAFFEKKLGITPSDFNELKKVSIDELLLKRARETIEMKCSEHGFVLPGSVKLISRSMGYFESARFTGDAVYYVKLEARIVYPADGVRITGEVIRKNKMGLYIDYRKALRIQIPRDLHIGNQEYENVEIGDMVEVELKRSKFQINDPYILASGIFIEKKSETPTQIENRKSGSPDTIDTRVQSTGGDSSDDEDEQEQEQEQEQEKEDEDEDEEQEQEQEQEDEDEDEEE